MKTLQETVNRILKRLEDSGSKLWSRSEIEGYVNSGYDQLTRATRCLWDMTYVAEDVTYCANHNYKWEEDYVTPADGFLLLNIFTFTGGTGTSNPPLWEQQYADNGIGPCNHTNLWEDDYTFNDFFLATAQLPVKILEVDRVTFDNYRIEPHYSKDLADHYKYYEYIQGPQRGYTLDKDGYFTIRKVPVPAAKGDSFTFSGTWGTQRDQTASDFETSPTVIGSWGILRSMPQHFPIGNGFGFPRRFWKDTKNVRIEYFRKGLALDTHTFEIPDRYVKYVELYAMALARERDGAGQDKAVAAHFQQRYQEGVARLRRRAQIVLKERVNRMGGTGNQGHWPNLASYPYHYPAVPR